MHTRKDRQRQIVLRIAAAILLLAAVIGFYFFLFLNVIPTSEKMSLGEYFGIGGGSAVGITAGSSRSETTGRIVDGKIYLDYESVHTYINPSVYLDEGAGLVIVTTPQEKTEIAADGSDAEGRVIAADGRVFLSMDYLGTVTDAEFSVYENPNRVYARTRWSCAGEEALKNAPVRYAPGIRSRIVAEIPKGEVVEVADVDISGTALSGKKAGWTRVVTPDGIVGYVRDRHLGKPQLLKREHEPAVPVYKKAEREEPINLVFHQTDTQASNDALAGAISGVSGVNVIAPTWFYLDAVDGTMRDVSSSSYVETAKAAGLEVWGVVNDFDGDVSSTEATQQFLGNYAARTQAIYTIMNAAISSGLDGICLDFELVREASAPFYLEFIREMSTQTQREGMVLAVCDTVPLYNRYMERSEQIRVADYIIVMCYDEYAAGSETAGSTASLSFTKKGIDLTLQEADADRIIAAIPFYTRLWTTTGDAKPESTSVGMQAAADAVREYGMTVGWDEKASQNYAESREGDVLRQIWLEDETSMRARLKLLGEYNLAGVAAWKLGLEAEGTWDLISSYLS